jgi:hypothetical protein
MCKTNNNTILCIDKGTIEFWGLYILNTTQNISSIFIRRKERSKLISQSFSPPKFISRLLCKLKSKKVALRSPRPSSKVAYGRSFRGSSLFFKQ